ncbi:TetR/AcrR family transcriptional regulator [Streptomyces fractus]|uniref:TetR/AcrR family transcriptional regulator n=1 Tax=Streptomyces fractus TaxID=641806 RepID=UPI003CE7B12E
MAKARRVGAQTSRTRVAMLACAEQLMLEEGYAAVSYRAVAARAGVTAGLVQYYFPALDDLFIALVRRRSEQGLEMLAARLAKGSPLRAVWEYASDWVGSALISELTSLSNHRKSIRAELAAAGEKARAMALDAIARSDRDYRLPGTTAAPEVLVFLLTAAPRMVAMEGAVGISTSHAEVEAFVEAYLDEVEPRK